MARNILSEMIKISKLEGLYPYEKLKHFDTIIEATLANMNIVAEIVDCHYEMTKQKEEQLMKKSPSYNYIRAHKDNRQLDK